MKKILIVDDNKNNRMILDLLLEDYMEENSDVKLEIDEAKDGVIAVDKVQNAMKTKKYDLIFMDIMMPNLDGIEATKQIRAIDKNVMIIAVSAVDDVERQKEILANGAEDYISKPVNADIFFSRIGNYLALITSRLHTKVLNQESSNTYTKHVFNRQLIFTVSSDDALSEFWEYYLLDGNDKYDGMSDIVRTVYVLGELQLKMKIESKIIVEESETHIYFSLTKIASMKKFVKLVLLKNREASENKESDNIISFRLEKVSTTITDVVADTLVEETVAPTVAAEKPIEIVLKGSKELEVFDYMDGDDLDELDNYLNQLNSLLLIVGNGGLEEFDVDEMIILLSNSAKLMNIYSESYVIAQSLHKLSNELEAHKQRFIELSSSLGELTAAFSADLQNWLSKTFHEGAPSVDFLDDTISSNVDMLISMISDNESGDSEEFDDIFDF